MCLHLLFRNKLSKKETHQYISLRSAKDWDVLQQRTNNHTPIRPIRNLYHNIRSSVKDGSARKPEKNKVVGYLSHFKLMLQTLHFNGKINAKAREINLMTKHAYILSELRMIGLYVQITKTTLST